MVRHFEEELDHLRNRLLEMSGLVEDSVYRSIQSLIEKNEEAAQQVLQNEARINRMEIDIDELATSLLARVQPMAPTSGSLPPPSRSTTTWNAWGISP